MSAGEEFGKMLQARLQLLVAAVGEPDAVAEAVGVPLGRLEDWLAGRSTPDRSAATLIVDLDHVLARAQLIWDITTARAWLRGAEPFLGGAPPLQVARSDVHAVIAALDAIAIGSYP